MKIRAVLAILLVFLAIVSGEILLFLRALGWGAVHSIIEMAIGLGIGVCLILQARVMLVALSPACGYLGTIDQELRMARTLERECTRSIRYKAPLVILALTHQHSLPLAQVRAFLRASDIVIRGRRHHTLVILTETPDDIGEVVATRLIQRFSIQAATMVDVSDLAAAGPLTGWSGAGGFAERHQQAEGDQYAHAVLNALRLGVFRARIRTPRAATPQVYRLTSGDIVQANATLWRPLIDDFTERAA